jgi:hypothetical protein
MENPNLSALVAGSESELKQIIVDYTGEKLQPENDEISVQQVIEVFASEFPEFVLAVAEENWISGYTQALKDVNFTKLKEESEDNEKLPETES